VPHGADEVSIERNESVDVLRKKIDQIDAKVVDLLNDRASLRRRLAISRAEAINRFTPLTAKEKFSIASASRIADRCPPKPFAPFFAKSFPAAGRSKRR
jgi:hypothetical protein